MRETDASAGGLSSERDQRTPIHSLSVCLRAQARSSNPVRSARTGRSEPSAVRHLFRQQPDHDPWGYFVLQAVTCVVKVYSGMVCTVAASDAGGLGSSLRCEGVMWD